MQQYIPVLGLAYADLAPLPFTKDNPYLSAATVAALSAANPGFAAGEPLYLSKNFSDIDPLHGDRFFTTTTYRAEASLDGNFHVGFGRSKVIGRSRVPSPAARTIALIPSPP